MEDDPGDGRARKGSGTVTIGLGIRGVGMGRLIRLLLVGIAAGMCLPATALADETLGDFSAVATADGGYAEYGIPGFLVVEKYVDGGGPTSEAYLDTVGTSRSFASLPYPGDTVVKYPGIVALLTGVVPPGYPLYAGAVYPSAPEAAVGSDDGPVSLTATAAADRSRGVARAGKGDGKDGTAFLSRAESEVVRDGGAVTATAVSVAHGIAVGPLSVAAVTSRSVTRLETGGKPVTSTDLSVEGGRVGDMAFTYGPEGFRVSDNGVPLPAAEGLAALNGALEPAGVSIDVVAAHPVGGGQAAAVFEVVSQADVPGAGPGTLRLGFGGATSAISGSDSGEAYIEVTPPVAESQAAAPEEPSLPTPDTSPPPMATSAETLPSDWPTDGAPALAADVALGAAEGPAQVGSMELSSPGGSPSIATRRARRLGELPRSVRVSMLAVVVAGLGSLGLAGSALGATRTRRTK